jgi:predicted  nucleic acid-binding Zn-ribbon protein
MDRVVITINGQAVESWEVYLIREIAAIKTKVEEIDRKVDTFMGQVFTDLEALRVAINEATNAVAQKISDLSGQISNSMTDEEVANLKAGLQTEIDRLNALAANPQDPVP